MRGVYIIFLRVREDASIEIGGLGTIRFDRGLYAYVGSAQNSLEKRVARHRSRTKKLRWHIDYLTADERVMVEEAYAYELPRRYECILAEILAENSQKPIKGFGSSDCRCQSHLFKVSEIRSVCEAVSRALGRRPTRIL